MENNGGMDGTMDRTVEWWNEPSDWLIDKLHKLDPRLEQKFEEFDEKFPYHTGAQVPAAEVERARQWLNEFYDILYTVLHEKRTHMIQRRHIHTVVVKHD